MVKIVFIICTLSIYCNNYVYSKNNLVSSVVMYRHGDRTPFYIYKNDPYQENYWPQGLGELTNIGKNQQFQLGQWLRKRYKGFLSETYHSDYITVRSSNIDRCLMSAASNLAGLYPPVGDQVWNPALRWQPIPIHTVPEQEDVLIVQSAPCPRYDNLYREHLANDELQYFFMVYDDVFQYLSENSGDEVRTIYSVVQLYDTLYIEELYNLTLPEWTRQTLPGWSKPVYPDVMKEVVDEFFITFTNTTEMARLKTGPLIDFIISHFEKVESQIPTTPKVLMISAHDNTLANLLNSLKLYDFIRPEYASMVIFEMKEHQNKYGINIFFKDSRGTRQLTLDGCGPDCHFDEFKEIASNVTLNLENWKDECSRI